MESRGIVRPDDDRRRSAEHANDHIRARAQGRLVRLGVWRSLYRWTTRRPLGPEDSETFGYAGPVTPVIWAFIGLSAIEIPVAHLLLPWQTARVIVLVVGI
jgi:hypothetical protein